MKTYIDNRGWRYRVMPGLGSDEFKARYQKPEHNGTDNGWKCVARLPWRNSAEEAQEDLDQLARKRGWKEAEKEAETHERARVREAVGGSAVQAGYGESDGASGDAGGGEKQ